MLRGHAYPRPGLTLVELLVVLVIIAMLSMLAIPLLSQTENRKTREAARVVASVIAKAQTLAISGGQGASVRFNQMNPTSKAFSEITICGPKRCYRGETPTARCKLVETNGLGPDMLSIYAANVPNQNHGFYELLPASSGDFVPAALELGSSIVPYAILRLNGRDPLRQVFRTAPKRDAQGRLVLDASGKAVTNDRLWVAKAADYRSFASVDSAGIAVRSLQNQPAPALDPASHTFELFLDGKPTGPPVTLPYDRAFDPRWLVHLSGTTHVLWNEYVNFDDYFAWAVTGQTSVRYFEVEVFDGKGRPQISDQMRTNNSGGDERKTVMAMLVGRADRAGQAWQQADLTDDTQGANWQYPDSHWVVVVPVKGTVVVEPCAPVASRRSTPVSGRIQAKELFEATAYIRQTVRALMP